MPRWPATALLLAVLSYSALWTSLRGASDSGWEGGDVEAGSGNSSQQCTPCAEGTEPDYDTGHCNCSSCNCSLLNPAPSSSSSLLSHFLRQSCNCSGFCENATSSCRQCDAGHYASSKGQAKCEECPAGRYSDEAGSITCLDCPTGQYTDTTGSTQCEDCGEGTYSGKPGAVNCTNCSTGTFSNDTRLSKCITCADGHYVDTPGATGCFTCGNGTFSNATVGHSTCRTCDVGHYCNKTGCDSCKACPAGTATRQPDRCNYCQLGTYSPKPASVSCTPCDRGTICGRLGCPECYPCPDGYQPGNGQSLLSCEPCKPGMFRNLDTGLFCEPCSTGYYQIDVGQSDCEICPEGSYCPYPYSAPRACPEDAQCPRGSVQALYCRDFYTYSGSKEKCVPKAILYITVTLVVLFVIMAVSLLGCALYWNFVRKKTRSYEKLPLGRNIKKPVSEPVYSGH